MLVIHKLARDGHDRGSNAIRQRQYSQAQQRVIFSVSSSIRNDLGKEAGIDKIDGHAQPKKGQKANDDGFERELKDIHIVILAGLAQTPESPVGFPVQLLPSLCDLKQSGEQVPSVE